MIVNPIPETEALGPKKPMEWQVLNHFHVRARTQGVECDTGKEAYMKFNLMKNGAWTELQELGAKLEAVQTRRRLDAEREWVQSLLRMCRRKVDPDDFDRWQEKYEDDCRWLRNSSVSGNP